MLTKCFSLFWILNNLFQFLSNFIFYFILLIFFFACLLLSFLIFNCLKWNVEKLTECVNLFATVKRVKEMRHSELIMSCHVKLNTGQKCRLQSSYNLITTCSSVLPALLHCVQIFRWSKKLDNSCNNSDFIGLVAL